MTTKKQRREQVAAKRAAYDAETKRLGLEAQRVAREKREQRIFEANRAETSKKAALKLRAAMEKSQSRDEFLHKTERVGSIQPMTPDCEGFDNA